MNIFENFSAMKLDDDFCRKFFMSLGVRYFTEGVVSVML